MLTSIRVVSWEAGGTRAPEAIQKNTTILIDTATNMPNIKQRVLGKGMINSFLVPKFFPVFLSSCLPVKKFRNSVNSVKNSAFSFQHNFLLDAFDAQGASGGGIGLDENAVGLETPARDVKFVRQQRAVLLQHAGYIAPDDRVMRAAEPGVGQVGGAVGQDLIVGGLDVGVGADDERGHAVEGAPHGDFLGGRRGVGIEQGAGGFPLQLFDLG